MARTTRAESQHEPVYLVLQGGGALGAYQAGVFEALEEHGHAPEWVAGMSIGAINCAIIAGNPPEERLEKLRTFWDRVSSLVTFEWPSPEGIGRRWFNEASAATTALSGAPGFFTPRFPPPFASPPGGDEAISFYDTAPLRETLLELVDFKRLNNDGVRFSVGAVNVVTGNFAYFDSRQIEIRPEHIMASGALPPGFPPVKIGSDYYWDGGLVSNTPLQYVLDNKVPGDAIAFQVDLFSARGAMPETLADVLQREKDIRYSSRTRMNTDMERQLLDMRAAAARLVGKLPPELRDDPDARLLAQCRPEGTISVVHLINRGEMFETQSKDYEFSRLTVQTHWEHGRHDAKHSLEHWAWKNRKRNGGGVVTYDLARGRARVNGKVVSRDS
ncbi:DUF3734 domain-containing protein [Altererythrobacter sp. B11]|uniref:DUF3734 domain-containing protein n=1 Tax=Altererythrobacter sp. B11 TaxID=2060312 RepID=UPI000E5B1BB8|nr:patatin-like phospholipase family protein [Altererythrobacter sp. B11]